LDSQIPRLELPSGNGAYVEFHDLDDLTGEDLHGIRKAIRQDDGAGETTNAMMIETMRRVVKTWEIPYLPDPRTPEANPAAWKKLKMRDLRAIEGRLQTVLAMMRPPADNDEPGSPTQPGSE
jgi:hypothetical protein